MRPLGLRLKQKAHAFSHDLQIFNFESILLRTGSNQIKTKPSNFALQSIYLYKNLIVGRLLKLIK